MFDISFTELMAISVVALLVIGPEKLPKVARMAGAFTGRIQKMVSQVKEEVNREVRFDELQKLQQEMAETGANIEQSIHQESTDLQSIVDDVDQHIADVAVEKPKRKPRAKSTKAKVASSANQAKAANKKSTTATAVSKTKASTKRATRKKVTASKKSTTSS